MTHKKDLMELLPAYLKRREQDVARLRDFIECEDYDSVRQLGHKLSGNGITFGFEPISRMGSELEAAAIARDLAKIKSHTEELFVYLANIEIRVGGQE